MSLDPVNIPPPSGGVGGVQGPSGQDDVSAASSGAGGVLLEAAAKEGVPASDDVSRCPQSLGSFETVCPV